MVSLIQDKLSSLVGRSSGYIESLPASVRRRVAGLKGVQKEHAKLEIAFQEEVLELEKKYATKFKPLYEKRAKIVTGAAEPTEEEVTAGDEEDDAASDKGTPDAPEEEQPQGEDVAGIPEFWLSAMKNHPSLAELITESDEAALKHLTDIRMEYLDKPGFRLVFEFVENEFFTNKLITKTYNFQEEVSYGGEFMYDSAEGDKIDWKAGKNLTVRIEQKKQRNKSKFLMFVIRQFAKILLDTKQTRVVKKTVPIASFFNFFDPPKAPADDDDGASEIDERLEIDYQLGEEIREKLIPRAVDWFTGRALKFEGLDDDEFGEQDLEDDDDEDDDDNDDDSSEEKDEEDESDEEVIPPKFDVYFMGFT